MANLPHSLPDLLQHTGRCKENRALDWTKKRAGLRAEEAVKYGSGEQTGILWLVSKLPLQPPFFSSTPIFLIFSSTPTPLPRKEQTGAAGTLEVGLFFLFTGKAAAKYMTMDLCQPFFHGGTHLGLSSLSHSHFHERLESSKFHLNLVNLDNSLLGFCLFFSPPSALIWCWPSQVRDFCKVGLFFFFSVSWVLSMRHLESNLHTYS